MDEALTSSGSRTPRHPETNYLIRFPAFLSLLLQNLNALRLHIAFFRRGRLQHEDEGASWLGSAVSLVKSWIRKQPCRRLRWHDHAAPTGWAPKLCAANTSPA